MKNASFGIELRSVHSIDDVSSHYPTETQEEDLHRDLRMFMRNARRAARSTIASLERTLMRKHYLKRLYKSITGSPLNLENPTRYTEKIQWRKIYDRNPLIVETTDKLKVRDYVRRRIGEDLLTKIYWVGKDPKSIPFNDLPNSFVLKTNHGCGFNIFVPDKIKLDKQAAIDQLSNWLETTYGKEALEWAYRHINRYVYAEEYLVDERGQRPTDYKFFVFRGKSPALFICSSRHSDLRWDFYDIDWNCLGVNAGKPNSERCLKKPSGFDKMKEYAEILGKEFDYVRIDLYDLNSRIIFGEMTHYPASGLIVYDPISFDYWMGSFWELPGPRK
jgi:hypothetical protein